MSSRLTFSLVLAHIVLWGYLCPIASAAGIPCSQKLADRLSKESLESLPWADDEIGHEWAARKKYYLVIGVTKIITSATKEDFATVDASMVAAALCRAGYDPVPDSPLGSVLSGQDATISNVESALKATSQLGSDNPLLVIYFSGHGLPSGTSDLYLPFYDAKSLTITESQSLKSLLVKLRTSYSGDLVVVLDACYSGIATTTSMFASVEESQRTAIITSSDFDEYSYPITVDGKEQSAFTHYFIEGLVQGGDVRDGLTTVGDVYTHVRASLNGLGKAPLTAASRLPRPMNPSKLEVGDSKLLAYSRVNLLLPHSDRRGVFLIRDALTLRYALKTTNVADLPGKLRVIYNQQLVVEYAVNVAPDGSRSLVTVDSGPDGMLFDASRLRVIALDGKYGSPPQNALLYSDPLTVPELPEIEGRTATLKITRGLAMESTIIKK